MAYMGRNEGWRDPSEPTTSVVAAPRELKFAARYVTRCHRTDVEELGQEKAYLEN